MPSAFFSPLFPRLQCVPLSPTGAASIFRAPGYIIAVAWNGLFLRPNQAAPAKSCSIVGNVVTLTFTTESGDRVYALCVA